MIYLTIFLLFIINGSYGDVQIEKYLKICSRNSPEVEDCLVKAIAAGLKTMAKGIPDLGIPSTDPFYQRELKAEYNQNQIAAKAVLNDILVHGLSKSQVRNTRLKANDDKFDLEVDMFTPDIHVTGKYNGGGGLGAFYLNTTGEYDVNMTDLTYTWKVGGKPETINGDTYVRITNFYMRPDIVDMKVHMTTDNPQYTELVQLGLRLVAENWRIMYHELLPIAQNNWEKIGIRIANKIFLQVPYDKLFPIDQ